jgi:uncharacterized MAPEG superfamily protein
MTTAEWCLFGAVVLYLVTLAPAKALASREFDNARPRDPAFYADPLRARILGAHINGIETFPFFAAAVLLAELRQAPQASIDLLAAGFLLTRIAFVLAYVGDKATLRTILWNVAFFFNIGIFFLPAIGWSGAMITLAGGLGWGVALWLVLLAVERRKTRN